MWLWHPNDHFTFDECASSEVSLSIPMTSRFLPLLMISAEPRHEKRQRTSKAFPQLPWSHRF